MEEEYRNFLLQMQRELNKETKLSSKEYDTILEMLDEIGLDKYTLDVMQGFNEWDR
jgi:hypothetical protein